MVTYLSHPNPKSQPALTLSLSAYLHRRWYDTVQYVSYVVVWWFGIHVLCGLVQWGSCHDNQSVCVPWMSPQACSPNLVFLSPPLPFLPPLSPSFLTSPHLMHAVIPHSFPYVFLPSLPPLVLSFMPEAEIRISWNSYKTEQIRGVLSSPRTQSVSLTLPEIEPVRHFDKGKGLTGITVCYAWYLSCFTSRLCPIDNLITFFPLNVG